MEATSQPQDPRKPQNTREISYYPDLATNVQRVDEAHERQAEQALATQTEYVPAFPSLGCSTKPESTSFPISPSRSSLGPKSDPAIHAASSGYHSFSSSALNDEDESDDNIDGEKEPRNFSWILDGLLCACAFPRTRAHFRFLANRGVTRIVSLTAEHDLQEELVKDFQVIRLRVKDFTPPTLDQIVQFVQVVEEAELDGTRVAVHCAAGKGRTGTVIACFLVKRFRLNDRQAVLDLRALRPGSVETSEQEETVKTFHDLLQAEPAQETRRVETGNIVDDDEMFRQFEEKVRLQSPRQDGPV